MFDAKPKSRLVVSAAVVLLATITPQAFAAFIDNGIPSGSLGYFSVNMLSGGESQRAELSAKRAVSGDIHTENVLWHYLSFINAGSGGFRLGDTTSATVADGVATSSGSFVGSAGNSIDWRVRSTIPAAGTMMTSIFEFAARDGTLGDIGLYQYLDEDLEDFGDDVFLTRGSAAGGDLELFTLDGTEQYGVSHGGAYSAAQGLISSSFLGWAVGTYDNMRPRLTAGTQSVAPTGVFQDGLSSFLSPDLGVVYGPADIVSVLGWSVDASATSATIVTTLGGVPEVADIVPDVPIPGSLSLLALGLAGFRVTRKQ